MPREWRFRPLRPLTRCRPGFAVLCFASFLLMVLGSRDGKAQDPGDSASMAKQSALAHNRLGQRYVSEGRPELAEEEFKHALDADPGFAEALNNLGVLYGRQGKNDAAEALFRQAIASNPQYPQSYVNLSMSLMGRNRLAEARETIENILPAAPRYAAAFTVLGIIQSKQGLGQEAVKCFRKAVELEPQSGEAHLNLGIASAEQYDLIGALSEFSEATRLLPASAPARYHKGRVLVNLTRYEEAKAEVEAALQLKSDYLPAIFLLAFIEKQLFHWERSIELFQRLVAIEPNNADARYLLGQSLFGIEKRTEAMVQWKRCVEINPGHVGALYSLSRYVGSSDPAAASAYQEQFLALKKKGYINTRVDILREFAAAKMHEGDWLQAVEWIREALDVCGTCPSQNSLRKELGLIYYRSERFADAESELRLALSLNPGDEQILNALKAIEVRRPLRAPTAVAPP